MPDEPMTSAQALLASCAAARAQNDLANATAHAMQARALARDQGELALELDACLVLAALCDEVADLDGASRLLEQARPLAAELADVGKSADLFNQLGSVLGSMKEFDQSFAFHEMAQRTAVDLGDKRRQIIAGNNLASRHLDHGEHLLAQGRRQEADAAFGRSIAICTTLLADPEHLKNPRAAYALRANLGAALQQAGRADEAWATLLESDALAAGAGMQAALPNNALYKARIELGRGRVDSARAIAKEGLAVGKAYGNVIGSAELHLFLCDLEEGTGHLAEALNHHKLYHRLLTESASSTASERSSVLAVRLQTEKALAEAERERERARELSKANANLTELALLDPLTGLANRRRLNARLDAAHGAAVASGQPCCVAMLDIDHFKHINDRYTHAVGDRVLQQLATLLRSHCREHDLAARYGGEEFVIVFSGVGLKRAVAICERLRASVQTWGWQAIAPALSVTTSIGVADLALSADAQGGLASADAMLYRAKAEGRNRVISHLSAAAPPTPAP
jgi:diguanylate cyclase